MYTNCYSDSITDIFIQKCENIIYSFPFIIVTGENI